MPKKLSTSTKASSRYNNDCSAKGIASNSNKIRKDAAVTKPISTGSSLEIMLLLKFHTLDKS